jgi:hypothetical protein
MERFYTGSIEWPPTMKPLALPEDTYLSANKRSFAEAAAGLRKK